MELRQRVLEKYNPCCPTSLNVKLKLWTSRSQKFFFLTKAPVSGWNLKNRGSKIQERNLKRRRKKREELFAAGFLGTRTHREGSLTAGALRTGFIGAGALREGSTETGTLRAEAGAHGARSLGEGTL